MRITIMNNDTVGVIADVQPHDLPLNAWSGARNMQVTDSRMEKVAGHVSTFTPEIDPHFLHPTYHQAGFTWLYGSNGVIRGASSGADVNLTRAVGGPYASGPQNTWTNGSLNGIPVLNSFLDIPQAWAVPGVSATLINMPGWPAGWRARSLRPFGNFLVALMDTGSTPSNPYLVSWSHPADPGALPTSWNIADPTKDAGQISIAETDDILVDQCTLGGVNIIYKERSAHLMQYIGGNSIFSIRPLLTTGILNTNCVQAFQAPNHKHIVLSSNDLYVHDGQSSQSIIRGRMRKWLFNQLSSDGAMNSFIAHNILNKEMWVCFPEVGYTQPSLALVWSYIDNTVVIREIPEISCAALGEVVLANGVSSSQSWEADLTTWDTDTSAWGFDTFNPTSQGLLLGAVARTSPTRSPKVFAANTSAAFDGDVFVSYVERIGLTVAGTDRVTGKPVEDSEVVKLVTEVWPRVEGDVGTVVNVFVGVQESRDRGTSWEGPFPFVIGTDTKVNPLVSGKILSIRFQATTPASWSISGYDLTIKPVGGY